MSGAGKTTIARCVIGLHEPDKGLVEVEGNALEPRVQGRSIEGWRAIQLVPQDPQGSLNPRRRVGDILRHSLRRMRGLVKADAEAEAGHLMERVRLSPACFPDFPMNFREESASALPLPAPWPPVPAYSSAMK